MIEGTALLRLFESEGTAAAQIRVLLGGPPTQPVPDVAHALVQSVPVPEPPTVILFIIGIASYGLIRTRWRATYNKGRCNIIHLRVTGTVP